ncbi:MAG: hypothetical protein NVS1B6_11620 [Steroidobacteraceae bacterium]
MRKCVLFVELVMNVTMLVIEVLVLLFVTGVFRISIVAIRVAVAIGWIAIVIGVAIAKSWVSAGISRPNRNREAAMSRRGGRHDGGKCHGATQK